MSSSDPNSSINGSSSDPQLVEELANEVVECIKHFVDVLRDEFKFTITRDNKKKNEEYESSKNDSIQLYTTMVDRGLLTSVQTISSKLQSVCHLSSSDFDSGATNDMEKSPTNNSNNIEVDLELQRSQLINCIIWPLLQALTLCYQHLDALPSTSNPSSLQPPQSTPTKVPSKQTKRSNSTKPPPPRGMLSIQNYTDIACVLEFTVCTSILPSLQPHVLTSIQDRVRYQLPKSLAGRIPTSSLLWVVHQQAQQQQATTLAQPKVPYWPYHELFQTASILSELVQLDRFRPMLLPRHIADIYAALFQSEHNFTMSTSRDGSSHLQLQKQYSTLYTQLGLMPSNNNNSNNKTSATQLDDVLQAKAFQTLLLHGAKTPPWMKQRVAPLLTQLASHNLAAIVQVFVPLQEPSMASQRLGQTLAMASIQVSTNDKSDNLLSRLVQQMLWLLEILYPSLTAEKDIPARSMALLQTIWAILLHWPKHVVQQHVIQTWQRNMIVASATPLTTNTTVHQTIRQIGSLCSISLPSTEPNHILKWLFICLPSDTTEYDTLPSLFDQLVRVASLPTVLASKARLDARRTIQLLSQVMCNGKNSNNGSTTTTTTTLSNAVWNMRGDLNVSPSCLLASAWVHALAPSDWDMVGQSYKVLESVTSSTGEGSSTDLERVGLENRMPDKSDVASLMETVQKRVDMFTETILEKCLDQNEQSLSDETKEPTKTALLGLPALLFRWLLKVYLSACVPSSRSLDEKIHWPHQLVAMALLPILSEKCSPESLLFGKGSDAMGLLKLIHLVLSCTESQLGTVQQVPSKTNVAEMDADVQAMVNVLEVLGTTTSTSHSSDTGKIPETLPFFTDSSQDETLLSIASIVLSLLIAVLELGSKLRSREEETALASMLPTLSSLAQFKIDTSTSSPEMTNAGIADMAGYAMALVASRGANQEEKHEQNQSAQNPVDKLEALLQGAEEDLGSSQAPLRARGMVTLGRLARGYLGIIPKEQAPLVIEVSNETKQQDTVIYMINEILRLCMKALADSESYVYLAAVQTLVAIGDMRPLDVLPILGDALVSGKLRILNGASTSMSEITLSQEQQVKLAEALMFVIRRRAAPDRFIPMLVNLMLFGNSKPSEGDKLLTTDERRLFAVETHNHFLGIGQEDPESVQETLQERLESQAIRVKAGGLIFAKEEADVVRSMRLSILAELFSVARPSALAPHCGIIVRTLINVLQLEESRSMCRAAALLSRELYGRLILVQDGHAGHEDEGEAIILAAALVSAEEQVLGAVLEMHASSQGNLLCKDPATSVRCKEALEYRAEAEESGIFVAAELVQSEGQGKSAMPSILTSIATKKGSSSSGPIIEIGPNN